MPFIDDEHDNIVFQQIDIEQHIADGQPPMLRMFGVTEVSLGNITLTMLHLI